MYGNDIRTCLDEIIQILIRIGNHQMYIQRCIRCLAQCLDNRCTDGQIRYEMAIHAVNMDIFCTCIHCNSDIPLQIGKVSRQNRRR